MLSSFPSTKYTDQPTHDVLQSIVMCPKIDAFTVQEYGFLNICMIARIRHNEVTKTHMRNHDEYPMLPMRESPEQT